MKFLGCEQLKYKSDLHIHSCLSPCGDTEMTPSAIAGMSMLGGKKIVAISDHNSTKNCRAFARAAAEVGIVSVPALELTTAEEVHVLCLLPDLDAAEAFGEYVHRCLPSVKNDIEFFGEQLIVDEDDNIVGVEKILLANATSIGVYDVPNLIKSFGGVAVPAHIDRPSFSLLSNLGAIDRAMGFTVYEVTPYADLTKLVLQNPDLQGAGYMYNSDAHSFSTLVNNESSIFVQDLTPADVIRGINEGNILGLFG